MSMFHKKRSTGKFGIGKVSLENHLAKLEASGLVRIHSVRSWGGTHQVAEITEKGLKD